MQWCHFRQRKVAQTLKLMKSTRDHIFEVLLRPWKWAVTVTVVFQLRPLLDYRDLTANSPLGQPGIEAGIGIGAAAGRFMAAIGTVADAGAGYAKLACGFGYAPANGC